MNEINSDDIQDTDKWIIILFQILMNSYTQYAEFEDGVLNKNRFIPSEKSVLFLDKINK